MAALLDLIPLAHELGYPHQEPQSAKDGGGSASAILIVAVVVVTVALAAALFWVRERIRRQEAAEAATHEPAGTEEAEPAAG